MPLTSPSLVTSNRLPQQTLVLCAIWNLSDDTPLFPCSSLTDWTFDNGHLYYKGWMYVPPSAWSSLLHSIHSSPLSGHLGRFRTKAIIERNLWWLGLSIFINNFITGCTVCQQNKARTHPVVPLLSPIKSSSSLPFKQLSVDLITNLPLSHGYDSLMVVVDHGLTKGVILTPCSKTVDVNGIAQLFLIMCSNTLDSMIPLSLTVVHSLLLPLLESLLESSNMMSAYHPQTDGQTE